MHKTFMAALFGVAMLSASLASGWADPLKVEYGAGFGQMYGGLGVNAEQMVQPISSHTPPVWASIAASALQSVHATTSLRPRADDHGRGWRATAAIGNRLAHSGDDDVSSA